MKVGWTGPGISTISIITNENLQRYDSNTPPVFTNSTYAFSLNNSATNGTVVGSVPASSQVFETIQYTIASGNTGDALTIDPDTGQITLKDATALTPGQVFNLSVGAQDDGYSGNLPLKNSFVPVTVSVSGTPLQVWKGQNFGINISSDQISGNLMDPDEDFINNLIEYALNLDPSKKDSPNNLPTVSNETSILKFTYRKNLSATDLTYNIQQATDLLATNPWSAAQITHEETLSDDGSTRVIRATLSNPGPAPRRFIRLQVEIN